MYRLFCSIFEDDALSLTLRHMSSMSQQQQQPAPKKIAGRTEISPMRKNAMTHAR